jgi:hypothetical protein
VAPVLLVPPLAVLWLLVLPLLSLTAGCATIHPFTKPAVDLLQLLTKHFGFLVQPSYFVVLVCTLNRQMLMSVLLTFPARLCDSELTAEVALHRLDGCSIGTRYPINAVLLEEHDGPSSHAAGEHHVCPQAADKALYLAWLVLAIERVIHGTNLTDVPAHLVYQDEVRTAPKLGVDHAIQTFLGIGRNCFAHRLGLLLRFFDLFHGLGQLLPQAFDGHAQLGEFQSAISMRLRLKGCGWLHPATRAHTTAHTTAHAGPTTASHARRHTHACMASYVRPSHGLELTRLVCLHSLAD